MTEDSEGRPTLLETIQGLSGGKNPAFTAVEVLDDPVEIRTFMGDYIALLRTTADPDIAERAQEIAVSNMRIVSSHYGADALARWQTILSEIGTNPAGDLSLSNGN